MMIETSVTTDAVQRREALDPRRSFIVQAPAGSGKTTLLTQRYLTLLAHVHHPEEIIAITFTRKAAAEMRNRIIEALNKACEACPATEHERHTWALAKAVLARDEQSGWNLLTHPARLRIHTIDALCNTLTRQMPVLSNFGAAPVTTTDMADLYREAARETLALLETGERWSFAIERLLAHLDNDLILVEGLLANMLEKRDQWLRHVTTGIADRAQQRRVLEKALYHTIKNALIEVCRHVPVGAAHQLLELMRYAASNPLPEKNCSIQALQNCESFPGSDVADLPAWLGIATLLLTGKGTWRKQADKNIGFPAPDSEKDGNAASRKEIKNRFKLLLDNFSQNNNALHVALNDLRYLPSLQYRDDQWVIMEALLDLLPVAVAQLHVVFRDRGQVDFSEVAQRAAQALGSADNPTDLALALDYRIQHLLVDEFQDTSFGQYQLLERLTAGWQHGDGRTLFLVGDPMQSIYRFREAEVGLFLRAREYGVGDVRLEPLTLRVNFRSQAGIVEWVNHAFKLIFPVDENISSGAVTYSPSTAAHPAEEGAAIHVHPCFEKNSFAEAAKVVAIIEHARTINPTEKIAILVRARSHLTDIVAVLQVAGLRYRAIEIENLGHRPVVQDLLALTRALLNPADRVAWLAILRAPWCGLTLADLHALVATRQHGTALFDVINATMQLSTNQLTIGGQARLTRLQKILQAGLAQRRRQHLRRWVEGVWLALGGPACVEDETDLEDATVFFDLLEQMQRGGDIENIARLEEQLTRLFALPDGEADESLQLMTIHKAKGLEFDTVIVPGLARSMPSDEDRLLRWMERPAASQGDHIAVPREESDLLLAPIKARGQKEDSIYAYLKYVDQQKQHYETARLLYVATTRAKKTLHLLGSVTLNEKDGSIKNPSRGSLLSQLWPVVEAEFVKNIPENISANEHDNEQKIPPSGRGLRRFSADWRLPDAPPHAITMAGQTSVPVMPLEDIEFLWASDKARHIGTVVHRMLRQIAQQGVSVWNNTSPEMKQRRYHAMLLQLGVIPSELEDAVQRVATALQCTLSDERGRWIVDKQHQDARCEYALSGLIEGKLTNIIIDRTFVDTQGCVSVAGGRMPGATDTQGCVSVAGGRMPGATDTQGCVSVAGGRSKECSSAFAPGNALPPPSMESCIFDNPPRFALPIHGGRMPGATDAQGIRWIIDYKTGSHEGSDVNAFLDNEQNRYRGQLERYAALMQQWDKTHAIHLGLYFPLIGGWRAWSY